MTGGKALDVAGVGVSMQMYCRITPEQALIVLCAVLFSTLLSGLYPAWRTARVVPVDAIKLCARKHMESATSRRSAPDAAGPVAGPPGLRVEVPALRGVSLRIERGEFTALCGPSGSGKTTLLNLVGALDAPSSGSVVLDGHDLSQMSRGELATLANTN